MLPHYELLSVGRLMSLGGIGKSCTLGRCIKGGNGNISAG